MAVTARTFRQHFIEFADSAKYPDPVIEYWAAVAVKLMNPDRWGDLIDTGVELFTAHNLVLEAKAIAQANNGADVGGMSGPVNSKSVDKVSIGYDTGAALEEGAGHWNLTIYGTRYIRMSRLIGAGPLHVGAGTDPTSLSSANAWTGVMF